MEEEGRFGTGLERGSSRLWEVLIPRARWVQMK